MCFKHVIFRSHLLHAIASKRQPNGGGMGYYQQRIFKELRSPTKSTFPTDFRIRSCLGATVLTAVSGHTNTMCFDDYLMNKCKIYTIIFIFESKRSGSITGFYSFSNCLAKIIFLRYFLILPLKVSSVKIKIVKIIFTNKRQKHLTRMIIYLVCSQF